MEQLKKYSYVVDSIEYNSRFRIKKTILFNIAKI